MNERKRQRKLRLATKLEEELRLYSRRDPNAGRGALFQKYYRPFLKKINAIEREDTCRVCLGSGRDPDYGDECVECEGRGFLNDIDHTLIDRIMEDGFEAACAAAEDEAKRVIEEARRGL